MTEGLKKGSSLNFCSNKKIVFLLFFFGAADGFMFTPLNNLLL